MPRQTEPANEEKKEQGTKIPNQMKEKDKEEIASLNRMLGAVMKYISDDEIQEIDIRYLLENTEGLKVWWEQYKERNRKRIEEEIKKSLSGLSLGELERIQELVQKKEQ